MSRSPSARKRSNFTVARGDWVRRKGKGERPGLFVSPDSIKISRHIVRRPKPNSSPCTSSPCFTSHPAPYEERPLRIPHPCAECQRFELAAAANSNPFILSRGLSFVDSNHKTIRPVRSTPVCRDYAGITREHSPISATTKRWEYGRGYKRNTLLFGCKFRLQRDCTPLTPIVIPS